MEYFGKYTLTSCIKIWQNVGVYGYRGTWTSFCVRENILSHVEKAWWKAHQRHTTYFLLRCWDISSSPFICSLVRRVKPKHTKNWNNLSPPPPFWLNILPRSKHSFLHSSDVIFNWIFSFFLCLTVFRAQICEYYRSPEKAFFAEIVEGQFSPSSRRWSERGTINKCPRITYSVAVSGNPQQVKYLRVGLQRIKNLRRRKKSWARIIKKKRLNLRHHITLTKEKVLSRHSFDRNQNCARKKSSELF